MRRVAVRGIVFEDGKLLCVKLKDLKTGEPLDYWCVFGGGLDENEGLEDGLNREMIEETGIEPEIGNLLYIQQFGNEVSEHLEFFFHIKNTDDYKNIDLSKTTHGTTEIAELKFLDPKTNNILPEFLTKLNLEKDIASNTPTQLFKYH